MAWRSEARSVSWVDQFKQLTGPEARAAIPSLEVFGLAPHRGTLKRLDDAFGKTAAPRPTQTEWCPKALGGHGGRPGAP